MNIYSIYKATNKINGKCYIGFDSNWPMRQIQHKYHSQSTKIQSSFYNSIRKYSWDNFEWCILYQSKEKDHTLKVMETHFIIENDSYNNGYNMTFGGEGASGHKHSEESKLKMSEAQKGKKGHIHSPETKLKIGMSNKIKSLSRKPISEETRKKLGVHRLGKRLSEETKLKISIAHKKRIKQL